MKIRQAPEYEYQLFLKNKSNETFAPLFRSFWLLGHYYCRKYFDFVDPETANDIVQESIIEVYKKEFANLSALKSFFYFCIANRSKNYLRKAATKWEFKEYMSINFTEEEEKCIFETELQAELRYLIKERLAKQERTVMQLVLQNIDTTTIAAMLNLSVQTIRNTHSRSVTKLKKLFNCKLYEQGQFDAN